MEIKQFEENIGYTFKNKELLKKALTHTSYAYENKCDSNEKLEFLGDSILEFISSQYLYSKYINLTEGEMTKVRAYVVCEQSLYKIAKKHNFSDFLYLGKSEVLNNGNQRPAILADSVEAVIAAIFLDSNNIDDVKKFIISNLEDAIEIASKDVGMKDYKTVLQEKLQIHGNVNIEYEIIDEKGPDHDKSFTAQVKCNGKNLAIGSRKNQKISTNGSSKNCIRKNIDVKIEQNNTEVRKVIINEKFICYTNICTTFRMSK